MAGPAGGASAGGNYGGNVNADQSYGGNDYRDQSYATQESINRADNRAAQREVQAKQRQAEIVAEEQRKKALGTGPLKSNLKPSYYQNFKNKIYQNSIKRNKVLAMRQLGLMKKGLPGLYGNLISGMTGKVPDWAKDFTEEDLMQIATSGPYLGQQNTVGDVSRFASGKDLLGRVTEGQSILDTGSMTQTDYERLFPNNINTSNGGDGQLLYPMNYNMGSGESEEAEEEAEEDTGPEYRFGTGQNVGADVLRGYVANGGRITRAGGGIMNAVPRQGYFLGGIGKAVGKVVGGVAKAAGKVLSSDVGKMALAGAAFYYGGGGSGMYKSGASGGGGFMGGLKAMGGNFFSKANPLLFNADKTLSLGKLAGISAALPFLMPAAKPNEDIGMTDRGGRLIDPLTGKEGTPASMRENIELAKLEADGDPVKLDALNQAYNNMLFTTKPYENYGIYAAANGGRIGKAEGGLMNLGGMEKDYRAEGGFVPIGKQEKADDVPARLSVNEFVFTADAVRNAGGGDIDKGAEVMENMMKNLENGGRVSEESQGNTGAQEMFSVSERIGEVI